MNQSCFDKIADIYYTHLQNNLEAIPTQLTSVTSPVAKSLYTSLVKYVATPKYVTSSMILKIPRDYQAYPGLSTWQIITGNSQMSGEKSQTITRHTMDSSYIVLKSHETIIGKITI